MSVDDNETAGSGKKNAEGDDTSEDRRFWQALTPASKADSSGSSANTESARNAALRPLDVIGDMHDLPPEELESRRQALRSMLAASEARQQDALRTRRPTLAIGELVQIASGRYKRYTGTVLDADFIHSRVKVQLLDVDDPQWLEFAQIAAQLPPDPPES